jgi:hypothetical protein
MTITTVRAGTERPEHEIKLTTPVASAGAVLTWLRGRCSVDAEYPEGLVTSIYYDRRDYDLLRAKVNSDFLKRKVRVRWYADPYTGAVLEPAFAEIKRKVGGRRFKTRLPLQHGATRELAAVRPSPSRLRRLLEALRDAGHWVEADLQPFLRIGFRRWRFIDPTTDSRVSVDTDIRGASINPGMLPLRHPGPLAHAVVEIKGTHTSVSRWLAPLRDMGCRPESFSKYARCYQKITRRSSF